MTIIFLLAAGGRLCIDQEVNFQLMFKLLQVWLHSMLLLLLQLLFLLQLPFMLLLQLLLILQLQHWKKYILLQLLFMLLWQLLLLLL
jgi:hypothetical protein